MKKHKTRKQKLQQRRVAGRGRSNTYGRVTESSVNYVITEGVAIPASTFTTSSDGTSSGATVYTTDTTNPPSPLFLEAKLSPPSDTELTGREWLVTIIGAKDDMSNLVTVDGREFVRSDNGRLYTVEGLAASVSIWEGIKVYDNHQTPEQYQATMGMRSPAKEWLGSIVNVSWDSAKKKLQGTLKLVEDAFAAKLKNAWQQGILQTIGLSIDSFAKEAGSAVLEGNRYPVLDGFNKALSVDVVSNPAAGGAFERILAANINNHREPIMDKDEIKELVMATIGEALAHPENGVRAVVSSTLAEALAASEEEESTQEAEEQEAEETEDEETEAEPQKDSGDDDKKATLNKAEEALKEAKAARFELMLARKIEAAKLSENGRNIVEVAFRNRVVEAKEVDALIKLAKTNDAANDPTGRVSEAGQHRSDMQVFDERDKAEIAYMQKLMGKSAFRALEGHESELVTERLTEAWNSWKNNGKEDLHFNGRMSELIRTQFLNGGWSLEDISYKEASTLASVIKNTVNVMTAVDYAGSNRWYESIVDVLESDNPIDDFTLVRLFGADSLDVVAKGAAYTEMQLTDEEETASHVKQGNFVAVHLEDLLADKIGYFRSLPTRLADAWYNTLSAKVAAVFTINSGVGPTLSDTGVLFNNTAVTTAGGHANLLTTALSWTGYDAVITAMYNQTARALGTGRKLVDMGPFTLLVPTSLRATGNKIRNSELQPEADGAGTAGNQSDNPYYQAFDIVQVPDWTDATDFAVLARYRGQSPIKLIFPRGMRTPQIYTADSELAGSMFTNDTIRYKLRLMTYRQSATDDCAPVTDFRTLHKSNVAG